MSDAEENVQIRIQIGSVELEVYGPQTWAEKTVKEYIQMIKETGLNLSVS